MVALVIPTPYVCDHPLVQPRLPVGRRAAGAAGAALAAAVLAGCGAPGHPGRPAAGSSDREWVQNATGVIDQLNGDVSSAALVRPGLAGARRSLRDLSQLYALLVAYTDFGGCSRMVGGMGDAPPRYARVVPRLDRACSSFEKAATLFTRAASAHDARALLAASRQVRAAASLLYRASLAIAAAQSARAG
jgi:hypothetical protein